MSYEQLEDFVENTLMESSKPYGRNYAKAIEEVDDETEIAYQRALTSLRNRMAQHKRYAKPVKVWTKEQEEMLARVDDILKRPIKK